MNVRSIDEFFLLGQQLPTVNNVKATSAQNVVKLSWDAPKDKRKSAWMYGIYYGVTMQEVFQGKLMGWSPTPDLEVSILIANTLSLHLLQNRKTPQVT